MAVLALVVDRRAPLHDALQPFGVEHLAGLCRAPNLLGQRQRRAAVAISHAQEHRPRLLVERQRHAFGLLGARQQLFEAFFAERVEHQHPRAREKRGVELEGRVLGGRADQDDRAVLHDGQKTVLLGAVEAMDLVDEKQRLAAVLPAQPRRLEHLLQVGDARKDRRYLLEGELRLAGKQPRDRRLAGAGRSPEDHRAERARADQPRQRAILAGQVLLADNLGEVLRAQPVGERR